MPLEQYDKGFQYAFHAAIRSYRKGSIPIGCAILDPSGAVASTGENSIYTDERREVIAGHPLAHAEINAILKLNPEEHPDIGNHVLYTTMEACPLCFGAIVMGGIRHAKFAAYDKDHRFVSLNTSTPFIVQQNIVLEGPFPLLQQLQVALIVYRRMEKRDLPRNEQYLNEYQGYCPEGAELGFLLFEDESFRAMISGQGPEDDVLRYMAEQAGTVTV